MKKICAVVAAVLAVIVCLTGCDPKKTGGGGKDQTYDRETGRYN